MPRYAAFGVALDCPFELPELAASGSDPMVEWRVEALRGTAPSVDLTPTGSDCVYGSVEVRGYVADDFARLEFDDTGTFDLHCSERVIRWYCEASDSMGAVRADLLGRVMALAAHQDGSFVIHASAVSTEEGVVALLGPKHAGKSTLALALIKRGAKLVTDDTLVVRLTSDGAFAAPGVQRIRLWPDSARALGAIAVASEGAKPTIDDLPMDSLEDAERRVVACCVIHPVTDEGGRGVTRRRLPDVQAALAGISFSKLGNLAGGRLGVEVFERATHLARAVAVYAVDVPRALDQVDAVAAEILSWQGGAAMPNVASSR